MGDIRPYRMKNESPSGGSGSHALLAFRRDIAPRGTGKPPVSTLVGAVFDLRQPAGDTAFATTPLPELER
jgi:hypothetical protein